MKQKKFRDAFASQEMFALEPKAFEIMFDLVGTKPTEILDSGVAIVDVCGPLEHHASPVWDSYDAILERLEEAFADDSVSAVAMRMDSPGGDAAGATEANRNIRRLKEKYGKPLYAYSNEAMYSAAYSVGCAADEIWLPDTGGVGSVGVICAVMDKTEQNKKIGVNVKLLTTGARKADSHADRELTDEIVNATQSKVDYLGKLFFEVVAECRGMDLEDVADLQAGCFLGQEAVDFGLADFVGGWQDFLAHVEKTAANPMEPTGMKTKSELVKERDALAKKITACRSQSEREKLLMTFAATVSDIATFKPAAKSKYVKETKEVEEIDDAPEDEEKAEGDDAEPKDSSGELPESEEGDEEEDEKMEGDAKELVAMVSKLTGAKSISEMMGAIEGMAANKGNSKDMAARLAKMEHDKKRDTVKALIATARAEGRIGAKEMASLETAGMRDPKWLKAHLSERTKLVHTIDEAPLTGDTGNAGKAFDTQAMDPKTRKMIEGFAAASKQSFEDYVAGMNKIAAAKSGNAPAKF